MTHEPIPVIFDTDLETDCDDVGALCLLHNLTSAGQCDVIAVVADACSDYIAPSVSVINEWYGRSGIPVGALHMDDYENNPVFERYQNHITMFEHRFPERLYNRVLPTGTPVEGKSAADYPDSVEVYRRALAAAADNSVVVCVVGFMSALARLLESSPDDISDLGGMELVARKVKRVVAMAVVSPCPGSGDGNFNFQMDLPAAQKVADTLLVPLYLSCWGTSITTGERLISSTPREHPGRRAYELYLRDERLTPPEWNRSSWDQVAALFSVVGEGELFKVTPGYKLVSRDQGFIWRPDPGGRGDGYIVPANEKRLETTIEDWMIGV